jgi:hypothetical protein
MRVGGQCHAPAAFSAEKIHYTSYRRLVVYQESFGLVWERYNIVLLLKFEP